MAEEQEPDEELELAESGGGSRKPIILIAALVVLVLAAGGAGLYFSGVLSGGDEETAMGAEAAGEEQSKRRPAIYVELDPPFTVNLKGESRAKYLQLAIQLLTRDPEVEEAIKTHGPVIRNNLVLLLGDKTSQELKDRAGKEKLQREVLASVQEVVRDATGKEGVENVLFTTFVMQ